MILSTLLKAFLVLAFPTPALAAGSWADVGAKKVAAVFRLNYIGKTMQGKQITAARVASLAQEMSSFYAPKLSCSAGDKATSMSFSLTAVPFAQCAGAFAKLWGNLKINNWQLENVAIDPASGGKTILTYQPSDFVGMTNDGVEVPGTELHKVDVSSKYTFNDQGLVTDMHTEIDSGLMEALKMKVTNYGLGVEQMPAVQSWASVGEKNVAAVSGLMDIVKELKGKQVTPGLMAKLSQDLASFYASKVSCSAGDRMSTLSFRLVDVSLAECTTAFATFLGNTKLLDWDMKSIAIDPSSGGAKILTYQPFDMVGTTTGGMDVPGTELHGVDMSLVYVFNEMGKVASFHQVVDAGIIEGVQNKVDAFGRGVLLTDASHNWAEVGSKNIATLLKMNDIAKKNVRGKQLALHVLTKNDKESSSFFASQVSCSAGDMQSSISFSLRDVPERECSVAFAKLFGNVKMTDWDQKNVAIDPSSSGKTILAYQPTDFVGTTTEGQEVPGTALHAVDFSWQYQFNEQGQIAAYHMEMDSGILEGVMNKVASVEQDEGSLAALSLAATDLGPGPIAIISATLGGFIGILFGLRASKRANSTPLLEGYHAA